MTDFYSTSQVGERLGVSARRVQDLAKAGRIPSIRHGRCIRIPVRAWEQFVAEQAQAAMAGMKEDRHAEAV